MNGCPHVKKKLLQISLNGKNKDQEQEDERVTRKIQSRAARKDWTHIREMRPKRVKQNTRHETKTFKVKQDVNLTTTKKDSDTQRG